MTPLIYFRCRETRHQIGAPHDGQPGSPITWHESRWAYCPLGVAEGHDWVRLEVGSSVSELKRAVREARVPIPSKS